MKSAFTVRKPEEHKFSLFFFLLWSHYIVAASSCVCSLECRACMTGNAMLLELNCARATRKKFPLVYPSISSCYSQSHFYYFLAWHLLSWASRGNLSFSPVCKQDYDHGSTGRFSFSTLNPAVFSHVPTTFMST